jgi:phosphatidylglycerophosphatase A
LTILPNLRLLFSHPAHFFSLGFGTGLAPKAPGTVGTIVGFPLYFLIQAQAFHTQLIIILLLFLIGIWCCGLTGKVIGVSDHGGIVWDEIVAMMLVLTFTPANYLHYFIAFLLFRLFDIWKPYPIRQFDAQLKGGFGVMFDDLLAALYTIISLKWILWILPQTQ